MSDSDDEQEFAPWKGASGSIILINASDSENLGTTATSLKAARESIRQTMVLSSSQVVGLCLLGTVETKSTYKSLENVVELMPLEVPSLENLKKIEQMDINEYGQATSFKYSDALWQCLRMFSACKRKLAEKQVVLLSRLDVEPPMNDHRATLKRIMDLSTLGITLKIINVSEEEYQISPFFEEMLRAAQNRQDDIEIPKSVWSLEDIIVLMRQRSHKNLASALIKFHLSEDLAIGVGVYSLTKPHTGPKKVNLFRETNEIVSRTQRLVKRVLHQSEVDSQEEGDNMLTPLSKSDIILYKHLGGRDIQLTLEEMLSIKKYFGPPALKLLGFKPASKLEMSKWYLQPCGFLFPNEDAVEGSTRAFRALHQACIDRSVIAICILCSRVYSKARLVALSPTRKHSIAAPSIGFHIIYLPFAENVKDIPDEEEQEEGEGSTSDYCDKGKMVFINDMMNKLKIDYQAEMFENPKWKTMYRAIEAIALEEEEPESICDTTLRSDPYDEIDAEQFEEMFGPFGMLAVKRGAGGNMTQAKRFQGDPPDEFLLKCRLENKEVKKYNVPDLRKILKWFNPPNLSALTGLKKDQLVDLVYEHCSVDNLKELIK